jgi:hypothetical protein
MMGVQAAPAQLFYDFCLDDHTPSDHLLRGVDRHLALGCVDTYRIHKMMATSVTTAR